MSKVRTYVTLVVLAMALTAMILPAGANLVATSFGFPVIVQSGTTTAFNQDTANATDNEAVDINFPVSTGNTVLGPTVFNGNGAVDGATGLVQSNVLPFGPVSLAFPSISQTVDQTQTITHTDFAQTNEFAEFAYPFVGVGGVALPGFGFGF